MLWLHRVLAPRPLVFAPELLLGLRPRSAEAYRRAIARFVEWMLEQQASPCFVWELDDTLYAYFWAVELSRSQASRTLTAVERVLPTARRQLIRSHALLQVLSEQQPVVHVVAMPWVVVLALAWQLAVMGFPRVGGLLLLQWAGALRPIEALRLTGADLTCAGRSHADVDAAVLALGTRSRTKVSRPMFVVLRRSASPVGVALVDAFAASTEQSEFLTGVLTVSAFGSLLRRACKALRTHAVFTPHSPRAGWASHHIRAGWTIPQLCAYGRWGSERALRWYLDVISAQNSEQLNQHLASRAAFLEGDFAARYPWW